MLHGARSGVVKKEISKFGLRAKWNKTVFA